MKYGPENRLCMRGLSHNSNILADIQGAFLSSKVWFAQLGVLGTGVNSQPGIPTSSYTSPYNW